VPVEKVPYYAIASNYPYSGSMWTGIGQACAANPVFKISYNRTLGIQHYNLSENTEFARNKVTKQSLNAK